MPFAPVTLYRRDVLRHTLPNRNARQDGEKVRAVLAASTPSQPLHEEASCSIAYARF